MGQETQKEKFLKIQKLDGSYHLVPNNKQTKTFYAEVDSLYKKTQGEIEVTEVEYSADELKELNGIDLKAALALNPLTADLLTVVDQKDAEIAALKAQLEGGKSEGETKTKTKKD